MKFLAMMILVSIAIEFSIFLPLVLALLRRYAKRQFQIALNECKQMEADYTGDQGALEEGDEQAPIARALIRFARSNLGDASTELYYWRQPWRAFKALQSLHACNQALFAVRYQNSAWSEIVG